MPKAVAVCTRDGLLLVERGEDRGRPFYRAIGGAIEFGERAAAAVAREWREEYGVELRELRLLGVLESVFTYEGRSGHEIVFVFSAAVPEAMPPRSIDTEGAEHVAAWVSIAGPHDAPVYPEGLLELIR